jgi:hypothetical protein
VPRQAGGKLFSDPMARTSFILIAGSRGLLWG